MDYFQIQGGDPLKGTVRAAGAKNAVLPILAAGLLTDQPLRLPNAPRLRDVRTMTSLMEAMGCRVEVADDGAVELQASGDIVWEATWEQVRQMRASICVLGPLVGRFGRAKVSLIMIQQSPWAERMRFCLPRKWPAWPPCDQRCRRWPVPVLEKAKNYAACSWPRKLISATHERTSTTARLPRPWNSLPPLSHICVQAASSKLPRQ